MPKALANYDRAVENPFTGNGYIGLLKRASLNNHLGQWDAAIRDWTEYLKHENNINASSELFRLLIECPDPALRDPRQAIAMASENERLLDWAPDERQRLLDKAKELMTDAE